MSEFGPGCLIRGELVTLRPAVQDDRQAVYAWLAESELTPLMLGPPTFPETPVPTWDEFSADYLPLYFDGTEPEMGRSYIIKVDGQPVGHISYSEVGKDSRSAEFDIWLRSANDCGRGYGPDALKTLMRHLRDARKTAEFIIRPSARNDRAILAYGRAGFVVVPLSSDEHLSLYGPGDYPDAVIMRASADG